MKIIIVEDEPPAARRLSRMILKLSPEAVIAATLGSKEEALRYFSTHHKYELVFLDISLGDGHSFELLEQTPLNAPIIFTTAYDEYAVEAFKHLTVDYLLKPIKEQELKKALDKYRLHFREDAGDSSAESEEHQSAQQAGRHLIRVGTHFHVIPYNEVAYYFIQNHIVYLMNFEGKKYPVNLSLEEIEDQCCDSKYFRINRQVIIHLDAIDQMHTATKSRLEIELQPPHPEGSVFSSTSRSPEFKEWLQSH